MDQPDNELAALAGDGDQQAWSILFERYQQPIYNFAYRMVDNAADAADIVQNSFIKVFMALGDKQVANFSAYLYRTARNLSYDEIRRRRRFADLDEQLLAPEDPNIYVDPQKALLLGQQIDGVRRAVGNLSENHRAALFLRELQDLDYDQIAEILESNRNAVGALLSRARLRFREELRMAQLPTEEIPAECEQIISLLSPYIDGELDADKREIVEGHLPQCAFCAAALEEMREASRSMRVFIPVLPPTDIAHAVSGAVEHLRAEQGGSNGSHGPNRLAKMARSRLVWATAGMLLVLGTGSALLAEGLGGGGERPSETATSAAMQAGVATPGTTSSSRTTKTQTTAAAPVDDPSEEPETASAVEGAEEEAPASALPAEPPAEPAPESGPAPGARPVPEPPPPVDPGPAEIAIGSGTLFPNPANDQQPVTFEVVVSGPAVNVSVQVSYASTGQVAGVFSLAPQGGGMWMTSELIYSGKYNVFAIAVDAAGRDVTQLLGVLDVYPYQATRPPSSVGPAR